MPSPAARLNRRGFVRLLGAAGASLACPKIVAASASQLPPRESVRGGPNVILIRFGGGVRRLETIDPNHPNFTPHLLHEMLPEGTVWTDVVVDGLPNHSTGTVHLTAGRYLHHFPPPVYRDELVPSGPTIFELARKHLGCTMDEVLYLNGDSIFLELLGWSDHPDYGESFRPGVLSQIEMQGARLRDLIAGAGRRSEEPGGAESPLDAVYGSPFEASNRSSERRLALWKEQLDYLYRRHYRRAGVPNDRIAEFWRQHARLFGNDVPRGDALAFHLASLALQQLRPRLMMVSFQDVDFTHWGIDYVYRNGLNNTDAMTWQLWQLVRNDPYYRDDTYFFVVPDCGRGRNPTRYVPYQHHDTGDVGSDEIFVYAWGPKVGRGVRVDRRKQQVDVPVTIGSLLGVRSPDWEGRELDELFG